MGKELKKSYCLLLAEKEREILQLKKEIIALKNQTSIDQMTGVLNKCEGLSKLNHEMKRNSRDNTNTTIAFIDIDGLKLVNDKYGHCAGDQLLVEISNILLTNIRKEDFVFRFGGDEFIIVFTNITKLNTKGVWERICAEIERFNKDSNFIFSISLSVGFYEYDGSSNLDINQFIHLADSEMYREKKQKRKDYKRFCRSSIV